MSHFIVLVIGANIVKQLAPFNEQPEADDLGCQLIFKDQTERYLKKYNEDSAPVIQEPTGNWNFVSVEKGGAITCFNAMYPTFEAFCKDWEEKKP